MSLRPELWVLLIIEVVPLLLLMLYTICGGWKYRLLKDTPTCKAASAYVGLVELKGKVRCSSPLVTPLSQSPCAYFRYIVEQRKGTDKNGNSTWKKIVDTRQSVPFLLIDNTGAIRIDPAGAKIDATCSYRRVITRGNRNYFGKCSVREPFRSKPERRFTEYTLAEGEKVYIMGQARICDDKIALEVAKDRKAPLFLITHESEQSILRNYDPFEKVQHIVLLVVLLVIALTGIGMFGKAKIPPSESLPWLASVGGVIMTFWVGAWAWVVYNSFARLRYHMKQARANIDVQLKRRHDLIPNLVRIVEGVEKYNRTAQRRVTFLRDHGRVTRQDQSSSPLRGCSKKVCTLAEAHPELQANPLFLQFQKDLINTEERITQARQYYNKILKYYNTRLKLVPERYVTRLLGFGVEKSIKGRGFMRVRLKPHFTEHSKKG